MGGVKGLMASVCRALVVWGFRGSRGVPGLCVADAEACEGGVVDGADLGQSGFVDVVAVCFVGEVVGAVRVREGLEGFDSA